MNARKALQIIVGLALVLAPAAALGAAAPTTPGSWTMLPAAPVAVDSGSLASAWTGKQLLVFGRATKRDPTGAVLLATNVAAAYDPVARSWHRLSPPAPTGSFMGYSASWTGRELLVWGEGTRLAFDPKTNRWRELPHPPSRIHDGAGLVVWSGRELIGWGGGCCGDAFSDGAAYNPATNSWRRLRGAPLAGSQHPLGAWTGRELLVFVGSLDPDGKPWPARLARAAAYNPKTDSWRRIEPLPRPRPDGNAVWDGRELLVVGGGRATLAYNPRTNRWRRLSPMPSGRVGATAVWTGKRLLLVGGRVSVGDSAVFARLPLAYDPARDRWSTLPAAPLAGRVSPAAAWTGRRLIVWGGGTGRPPYRDYTDGAAFKP
jgi:N-acetylneuraminic acid mutarotase